MNNHFPGPHRMHANLRIVAMATLLCLGLTTGAEGQLVRKAGQFLAGKVFRETAKETSEQGAKLLLRKAGTEATKQTAKNGLRRVAGGAVTKTAISQSGKLIATYGDDATRAMARLSPQNSRRLAMMADEIETSGQGNRLMKLIVEGGDADKIINFMWRNKEAISGGVILTTLIANPDAVLGASSNLVTGLADAGGEFVIEPVIEHVARPMINWLGCFLLFFGSIISGLAIYKFKFEFKANPPSQTDASK